MSEKGSTNSLVKPVKINLIVLLAKLLATKTVSLTNFSSLSLYVLKVFFFFSKTVVTKSTANTLCQLYAQIAISIKAIIKTTKIALIKND